MRRGAVLPYAALLFGQAQQAITAVSTWGFAAMPLLVETVRGLVLVRLRCLEAAARPPCRDSTIVVLRLSDASGLRISLTREEESIDVWQS